jgi:hypothetical protein
MRRFRRRRFAHRLDHWQYCFARYLFERLLNENNAALMRCSERRHEVAVGNPCVPWAVSLSLGR